MNAHDNQERTYIELIDSLSYGKIDRFVKFLFTELKILSNKDILTFFYLLENNRNVDEAVRYSLFNDDTLFTNLTKDDLEYITSDNFSYGWVEKWYKQANKQTQMDFNLKVYFQFPCLLLSMLLLLMII